MSEWIIHGTASASPDSKKKAIFCFGGTAMQMGSIPPFEFLTYLSTLYKDTDMDLYFYIDKHQCWYQNGLEDITHTIQETADYLRHKAKSYDTVVFMGVSAGGYAAILFGSLCRVSHVVSFIPQTRITGKEYTDLALVICPETTYSLYGDTQGTDLHDIAHCDHLASFDNVTVVKQDGVHMKELRDTGTIQAILDRIFLAETVAETVIER